MLRFSGGQVGLVFIQKEIATVNEIILHCVSFFLRTTQILMYVIVNLFYSFSRFIRKGVDPAPLAENGLTEELLERLSSAAGPRGHNTSLTGNEKELNL